MSEKPTSHSEYWPSFSEQEQQSAKALKSYDIMPDFVSEEKNVFKILNRTMPDVYDLLGQTFPPKQKYIFDNDVYNKDTARRSTALIHTLRKYQKESPEAFDTLMEEWKTYDDNNRETEETRNFCIWVNAQKANVPNQDNPDKKKRKGRRKPSTSS